LIASVRGPVIARSVDHVVIDAAGVGYKLLVSTNTLQAVPAVGEEATLLTHLVVREDVMQLYGFATDAERQLFLNLITVSQVGPKVALSILCSGTPAELTRALATGDHKRFQAANGVGKRTAERIVVELREKVAGELGDAPAVPGEVGGSAVPDDVRTLAREGLVHLGYLPAEADAALARVEGDTVEDLINAALRSGKPANL
jgi:Holliday junction DNA helicase RuvA